MSANGNTPAGDAGKEGGGRDHAFSRWPEVRRWMGHAADVDEASDRDDAAPPSRTGGACTTSAATAAARPTLIEQMQAQIVKVFVQLPEGSPLLVGLHGRLGQRVAEARAQLGQRGRARRTRPRPNF